VHAIAADNVAVTAVSVSWSGAYAGNGSASFTGTEWEFGITGAGPQFGAVTIVLKAMDAAGNQSAPQQIVVNVSCFG
jgi:hypothetical protein